MTIFSTPPPPKAITSSDPVLTGRSYSGMQEEKEQVAKRGENKASNQEQRHLVRIKVKACQNCGKKRKR